MEGNMKKLLLVMALMLLSGIAWANTDNLASSEYSASGQVSAAQGIVCAVTFTDIGGTAGDKMQLLNSTTSSGNSEITMTAATANATVVQSFSPCVYFSTGIYLVKTGSGTYAVDVQYQTL